MSRRHRRRPTPGAIERRRGRASIGRDRGDPDRDRLRPRRAADRGGCRAARSRPSSAPTEKGIQLLVDSLEQVRRRGAADRCRAAPRRGVLAGRSDARARPAPGASTCPSCSAAAGRRSACACPTTTCRGRSRALLGPLAASSANISGEPDATTAELVAATLGDDAGARSSTTGRCAAACRRRSSTAATPPTQPRVLREGAIVRRRIAAALGRG